MYHAMRVYRLQPDVNGGAASALFLLNDPGKRADGQSTAVQADNSMFAGPAPRTDRE